MTELSPREAYALWAPTYCAETAISFIDEELSRALSPSPSGLRVLDAGCGVGRRMPRAEAALTVGVDISFPMLYAGRLSMVAAANICALPFADGEFDLVWCRLVLGHLAPPQSAYGELARVCRHGGHLLVTDFHPDAVAAGHKRSFRDTTGAIREVEHYVHDTVWHKRVAQRAGLTLCAQRDGVIGPSVQAFYDRADRAAAYDTHRGLAVVAAFLFRSDGLCAS